MNIQFAKEAIRARLAGDIEKEEFFLSKMNEPKGYKVWFIHPDGTCSDGETVLTIEQLTANQERSEKYGFAWPTVDFNDAQ